MAVYILPYRYLIETEEEKMDVEYMSCYYEDMIEKIMKEALTEEYWNKAGEFCDYYDEIMKEAPEILRDVLEKVMEHYEMIEAQVLKEMYLRGASDLEKLHIQGKDASSSIKMLETEYGSKKKQIYDEVSQILKVRENVRIEWHQKHAAERQIYKEMSYKICRQYETLMKIKKMVNAVERRLMYLQGALDRSRMLA